jgi:hypothetical protein
MNDIVIMPPEINDSKVHTLILNYITEEGIQKDFSTEKGISELKNSITLTNLKGELNFNYLNSS